jgi:D-beta-D-heptose 7-phosphate kinase/D-beta-D-heptose 1-phosphate adenosyltransferase
MRSIASPTETVQRFQGLRVLVIGDAMLDTYIEGTACRLCTEGPVPVVRKTAEDHLPGGAANTAANLAALGAEVLFLALVGPDPAGALLRSALRVRGVDDSLVVVDDQVATLQKVRMLADDQYVVRFDAGDTRTHANALQPDLAKRLESVYPDCDLVVISDYCYGVAGIPLIVRLRELRAARPRPLIVDSKDLAKFAGSGATLVTPNQLELQLAVKQKPNMSNGRLELEELERLGRELLSLLDAEFAAVTIAARGALVIARQEQATHVPTHPVRRANDVGAGDSFTAAAALAVGAGATPVDAARIAVEASRIAVTKRRTALVRRQELLQRVSLEEPPASLSVDELAARLNAERLDGRTIVFTNGVFDILHAGHVRFLRGARRLGDVLVVGVNSDASARRLQGENRPINSERDRTALVAALEGVDHAIAFDEDTPEELIRILRPNVHVKGGDYADVPLPEARAVREVGGRVEVLPLIEAGSTSAVIERIITAALREEAIS